MNNKIQYEGINHNYQKLLTLYNVANEQNKLYAEFRWKVFYYISFLNGCFFVLFMSQNINSTVYKLLISFLAFMFTLFHIVLIRQGFFIDKTTGIVTISFILLILLLRAISLIIRVHHGEKTTI